jgi:DNA-binding winged helix-turn-helix (wHTH) protein
MGAANPVRFGEFVLDGDLRQLWGPSGDLHLSPKAFDLLVLLVTNRQRVLSKNELQEHLWPDTFVVETNLASLVAEIREALHDDAKSPRFVRTAHRVGYAFCGTVSDESGASVASTSALLCWLLNDGRRVPLQAGENILGRDVAGSINLDSPSVSRRHARIHVSVHEAMLEDLGSKNGTYLRGERVSTPVPLSDGDEVRVGSVVLRFRQQSGPRSTMTVASAAERRTFSEPE